MADVNDHFARPPRRIQIVAQHPRPFRFVASEFYSAARAAIFLSSSAATSLEARPVPTVSVVPTIPTVSVVPTVWTVYVGILPQIETCGGGAY
jgi:hypothetical protein